MPHYKHFNPVEHKIESKIASVKQGFHCKFNINYHIIWIPKYRKPVLADKKVKEVLKTIIQGVCYDNQVECLALEIMPDHLHLFVGARPTTTPCELIQRLKGNTSIQLRRCFPQLRSLGYAQTWKRFNHLWASGYYCGSAGHVSQDAVRRYIAEQQGKDVFEYSIFENPQRKIGDFTQSKLERWSA